MALAKSFNVGIGMFWKNKTQESNKDMNLLSKLKPSIVKLLCMEFDNKRFSPKACHVAS